ncbi:hypothetical protein [Streptomyces sp. KR55]|uniref:hypothetical protein n=1 Tax=Streptomyces sp. KR55 TaxID=3457425 RepID=UPI003FD3602C
MSEEARELLPLVGLAGGAGLTNRDRLEVLTALINAPSFDPLFRPDIIVVPPDHPTYAWQCGVAQCERPKHERTDFCHVHHGQWSKLRRGGDVSLAHFLRTAKPLRARSYATPPPCVICGDVPAWNGARQLCYLHHYRLLHDRWEYKQQGLVLDEHLDEWMARQPVMPAFGPCQVDVCPEEAVHLLGLCRRHFLLYKKEGKPGGARVPNNWGRMLTEWGSNPGVSYDDQVAFCGALPPEPTTTPTPRCPCAGCGHCSRRSSSGRCSTTPRTPIHGGRSGICPGSSYLPRNAGSSG